MIKNLMCLILVVLFTPHVYADEDSVFASIARLRKYAGGADESDLKVQTEIKKLPTKKKKQFNIEQQEEGF